MGINGKIHYKWSFSIAMLDYQRVKTIHFACQEWVMALNFLEAWHAEIPWSRPAEASSSASGAAAQLQREAEDLIETWRCGENLDLGNGKHL